MVLQGGEGRHESVYDGGDGGHVILIGGESNGRGHYDHGGNVNITAGESIRGTGGSVDIASGSSWEKSSGGVSVATGNAGDSGVSGDMSLATGDATARYDRFSDGHAGSISMTTGKAHGMGRGGDISLQVGTATYADGGDIRIAAGKAQGTTYIGGSLSLSSGGSDEVTGDINMSTPSSRDKGFGSTGSINIKTGKSYNSHSGSLNLETGDG